MQVLWLFLAISILVAILFYPQVSMWFVRRKRIREGMKEDAKIREEVGKLQ